LFWVCFSFFFCSFFTFFFFLGVSGLKTIPHQCAPSVPRRFRRIAPFEHFSCTSHSVKPVFPSPSPPGVFSTCLFLVLGRVRLLFLPLTAVPVSRFPVPFPSSRLDHNSGPSQCYQVLDSSFTPPPHVRRPVAGLAHRFILPSPLRTAFSRFSYNDFL